jgi:hypothetical protein
MSKDEEIDDQVNADLEFTRRAEELLFKLRTQSQGTPGPSVEDEDQKDKKTRKNE